MDFKNSYMQWVSSEAVDEKTKNELKIIENDEAEIKERFYKNLEFGTGGLRGILGAGTNRMNVYTVRKATQGLANFICSLGEDAMQRGVAISYDSRHFSEIFARETASTLAANGIKAYLSDTLRPVPQLSYAVRYFKAVAGVMITASHNPPEYNGYKAYGEDGGQLPPESADIVLAEIEKINIFSDVKTCSFEEAENEGKIVKFGEEFDNEYYKQVLAQRINPEAVKVAGSNFKMIYTPLHGSGNVPVRRVLELAGFENVEVVEKQAAPDGDFPTVKSPNPENKEAFTLAMEIAENDNADIIIGTDPDCDRIGVVVKNTNGEFTALTGNMVGALLTEYILGSKKAMGELPENGVVIKTIVTSYMSDAICRAYGVEVMNVLTGFKFIGEKIKEFEQAGGSKTYLLGFEESYGYLVGTYARDKDAVVSAMLIAEMAAWYKMRNMTLYEGLMELYDKYGTYRERLISITLEGIDGNEKIQRIMSSMRQNPPRSIAGLNLNSFDDYLCGVKVDLNTGATSATDLPKSNVLLFKLENETWFAARPSGTEPKIKFYFGTKANSVPVAEAVLDDLAAAVKQMINVV